MTLANFTEFAETILYQVCINTVYHSSKGIIIAFGDFEPSSHRVRHYTYVGFMPKRVKLSSCPHSSFLISFSGKPSEIYDKNNPDWAPNKNLGYDFRGLSVTSHERYERTQGRSEKRRRSECASALLELSCHQPSDEIEDVDEDASLIES